MNQATHLKILVAEDDFITNMFIESTLQSLGYAVVAVVIAGEEAVSMTQTLQPDVILMDIGLRGNVNGIEAALAIRHCSTVPIIFLTGNSDLVKNDLRIQTIAPLACLLKPIDAYKLAQVFRELFPEYSQKDIL